MLRSCVKCHAEVSTMQVFCFKCGSNLEDNATHNMIQDYKEVRFGRLEY